MLEEFKQGIIEGIENLVTNVVAYAGNTGVVEKLEHFIGFGGEMVSEPYNENQEKELIDKWREICVKKISEAYEDFMKYKNNNI